MLLDGREEKVLFRHYEKRLLDFCAMFKPVMPKSVVVILISFIYIISSSSSVLFFFLRFLTKLFNVFQGTACMYFRRFYLNNSLMEYHPRTIM